MEGKFDLERVNEGKGLSALGLRIWMGFGEQSQGSTDLEWNEWILGSWTK